jgi:hypothetical protein
MSITWPDANQHWLFTGRLVSLVFRRLFSNRFQIPSPHATVFYPSFHEPTGLWHQSDAAAKLHDDIMMFSSEREG